MSIEFSPSAAVFHVDLLCRKVWAALFGEHIQGIREEKGISIEEAARRAGMTVAEWVAIEASRVPESWEQICAIAKGLKEKRVAVASLVLLYAGAWEKDQYGRNLPQEISQQDS
jgi:transcriptional regulator with XRE-family HTH domain